MAVRTAWNAPGFAQQGHAEMFVIGTELDSMANITAYDAQWRSIIADVRSRFSGKLLYAASRDGYSHVPFYDALDYISMEGYYPLATSTTAHPTVDQLVSAWRDFTDAQGHHRNYVDEIGAFQTLIGKPVVFTEMSYTSSQGTATAPGIYFATVNQQDQANAYEAFYRVWTQVPWFAGYFRWELLPHDFDASDNKYDVRGKLAEQVIGSWLGATAMAAPNLPHPATPDGALDTVIDIGPVGPVNPTYGHFMFHSPRSGVTFQCRLDIASEAAVRP